MKMHRILKHVIAQLISLFIITAAFAGPPFLTDDTDVTDYQQRQLYFYSMTDAYPGTVNLQTPAAELDWGFAPNLEVEIAVPLVSNIEIGMPNATGLGDTSVSLGYRFHQETAKTPAIAFIPEITIPTGNANKDLGNGKIITQLPFWFQKSIGNWTIDTGGGYNINHAPQMFNNYFGGFLLQNQINQKLSLGGEIFYQGAQATNQEAYTALNLGGTYNFTPTFSLLFSAGNSIAGQQNFISYLGLYWASSS
ncbi:MAG: transporter [Legionellales bacterium]|nr:transporter [Legionellales bacterium]